MFLKLATLQHINCITHEGKVLVFATDADGGVWYTVRRDGFEPVPASAVAAVAAGAPPPNWEDFVRLELPNDKLAIPPWPLKSAPG